MAGASAAGAAATPATVRSRSRSRAARSQARTPISPNGQFPSVPSLVSTDRLREPAALSAGRINQRFNRYMRPEPGYERRRKRRGRSFRPRMMKVSSVGERARVHQLKVVEPREEPLEADARLGAGETGAGTEVLAVTEGDVAPGVRDASASKRSGSSKTRGSRLAAPITAITIGPRRDVDAGEARIAQGQTEGALDGTLEAQALLDEVRDRLGIAAELRRRRRAARRGTAFPRQSRRAVVSCPAAKKMVARRTTSITSGSSAIGEPDAWPAGSSTSSRGERAALLDVAGEVGMQVREHLIAKVPAFGVSDRALLAPQPAAERLVVFARDARAGRRSRAG